MGTPWVAPAAGRVFDVCTGSGAIAVALAGELPGAMVWASDVDPDALAVARVNCLRHAPRVRLVCADLLAACRPGAVDLVVANPPYVSPAELAALAPEVRDHEPRQALDGVDGLDVTRRLLPAAADALIAGGWLVTEMGAGQTAAVRAAVTADARWERCFVVDDASGIPRVLAARRGDGEGRSGWTRS